MYIYVYMYIYSNVVVQHGLEVLERVCDLYMTCVLYVALLDLRLIYIYIYSNVVEQHGLQVFLVILLRFLNCCVRFSFSPPLFFSLLF